MKKLVITLAYVFVFSFSININAQQIINEDVQIGTDIPFNVWGPHLRFGNDSENTDPIFFSRYNIDNDKSELRLIIGDYPEDRDKFSIGYRDMFSNEFVSRFVFQPDGRAGFGTISPQSELDVNGTIRSNSILIPNGKLGIGLDNPLYNLDVNGIIHINGEGVNGALQLGGNVPFGSWGPHLRFGNENENTDPIFISRYNIAEDKSELRVVLGDYPEGRDKLSIGYKDLNTKEYIPRFTVQADGKVGIKNDSPVNELDVYGTISSYNSLTSGSVGIGTTNTEGYKLAVNGTIRAKEIKVESNWADFVFKKDYKLLALEDVKKHIEEKGTLPGVPSESDVKANGVNLGEVNAILLQKIEELTLYVIKQQEEINELKEQLTNK